MKPTIIELPAVPTKPGARKLTITQKDLVEVELLRQEAKAANFRVAAKTTVHPRGA